jgi:hypothetical protein
MAIQLLKLRGVPEDELSDVCALLEQHQIDFYETSAGNWGISMPALWLRHDHQFPQARALLDDYQAQRRENARAEYLRLKQTGRARGFLDIARENPLRYMVYVGLIAGLIYVSIMPFLRF